MVLHGFHVFLWPNFKETWGHLLQHFNDIISNFLYFLSADLSLSKFQNYNITIMIKSI